jgi:phosphoglycerate dehydrogenase-like enzyme
VRVSSEPRRLVVDLRSRSKAFRISEETERTISAATPAGWETCIVEAETDSFGDGAQSPSQESLDAIATAEVYLGYGMPKSLFAAAKKLKWTHTGTAGVASLLFPEMMASPIVITNSAGVIYGSPIAEHVLGGVLHFLRGFDVAGALQRAGKWDSSPWANPETMVRELCECRVLVVGAGGIGGEVARRFGSMGASVTTVRRDPAKGTPPGASKVITLEGFEAELPTADVLVIATPLTTETRALLTAERIAMLPPGAILCNDSRGALVDEAALVTALTKGRLRGAVLDVFAKEPLAADSPLWQLPSVLHTPHISGVSPRLFWSRLTELFLDNWERWRAGAPLRNLVDKQAGY